MQYAAWAQGVAPSQCESAARHALATVDLTDQLDRRAGALSGGQQQRLGIACAIAHSPSLLLLDEPTAGLDPAQRVQIRSHLASFARSATVIVSTHIVEDLALMASNVVVMEAGEVRFTGTVDDLATAGRRDPIEGLSDVEAGYIGLLAHTHAMVRS